MPVETEIKIRVDNIGSLRKRLRGLGFHVHEPRVFESNTIFDFTNSKLRRAGELLRLREVRRKLLITYKGRSQQGPYKTREEIESRGGDAAAMVEILLRLGLKPTFRYEKYRTEYMRQGSRGIVTVDETPVGNYLEIEGTPAWIESTARELGHDPSEYITKSYGALYFDFCREKKVKPTNMVFPPRTSAKATRHRRMPDR